MFFYKIWFSFKVSLKLIDYNCTPRNKCGSSSGVEHNLAKVRAASSNLVSRSICGVAPCIICPGGGIGRHEGLKIPWPLGRAGSSPASGTTKNQKILFSLLVVFFNFYFTYGGIAKWLRQEPAKL